MQSGLFLRDAGVVTGGFPHCDWIGCYAHLLFIHKRNSRSPMCVVYNACANLFDHIWTLFPLWAGHMYVPLPPKCNHILAESAAYISTKHPIYWPLHCVAFFFLEKSLCGIFCNKATLLVLYPSFPDVFAWCTSRLKRVFLFEVSLLPPVCSLGRQMSVTRIK